jgi:hypothetical protein
MIYALDPVTKKIQDSQPMAGKPWRLLSPPPAPAKKTEEDKPPVAKPDAAMATADAASNTPEPELGPSKKYGVLRGCFEGVVWDKADGKPLSKAAVYAFNRRGKKYEAVADPKGRYRLDNLPWGTYQIVAEAPGYNKLALEEQTLALTDKVILDLKMTKPSQEPAPEKKTEP